VDDGLVLVERRIEEDGNARAPLERRDEIVIVGVRLPKKWKAKINNRLRQAKTKSKKIVGMKRACTKARIE
jgi:hypothetical protein